LLRKQKADIRAVEKLILRAHKDLKTAKANLDIDEGIAYRVAYLAMLHAARAFIKICQNTPQLCWGDEWPPSPLGGEG